MAAVWRMWKENVGLEQIQADWFIVPFSAKWLGSEEVFYNDCRNDLDDKQLLNDILVSWGCACRIIANKYSAYC
jgi:hypothetical protein